MWGGGILCHRLKEGAHKTTIRQEEIDGFSALKSQLYRSMHKEKKKKGNFRSPTENDKSKKKKKKKRNDVISLPIHAREPRSIESGAGAGKDGSSEGRGGEGKNTPRRGVGMPIKKTP